MADQQTEQFLASLAGKHVAVHTIVPGSREHQRAFHGVLESNYADAIVVQPVGAHQPAHSKVLIYKHAIAAIEAYFGME